VRPTAPLFPPVLFVHVALGEHGNKASFTSSTTSGINRVKATQNSPARKFDWYMMMEGANEMVLAQLLAWR
jgi:hypothetical protein